MITSSHVAVVLGDGGADIQVTVLAVHVVGSRPRVVSEPDAEVLGIQEIALLANGLSTDDLSGSLLELAELRQEIPQPRLRNNLIGCEDP